MYFFECAENPREIVIANNVRRHFLCTSSLDPGLRREYNQHGSLARLEIAKASYPLPAYLFSQSSTTKPHPFRSSYV